MATNTVEYFSRALGNGVINNAASDATLREILNSLKDQADQQDDDDDELTAISNKTGKVLKASSAVFKSLTAGISNTALAGKNFVTMIAKGEDRLSVYGKFLQDDVIKKLPLVGEALGGFAGILVSGVEALESWNDDLKQANAIGATFGHSLIEFKLATTRMGVSSDELINFISENNEKIVSLGAGTLTNGLRKFVKLSENMFLETDKVSDELDRMGYSSLQQNELLLDYLYATRRSKKITGDEYEETSSEFLMYAKNLDALTKLTGKNRNERQKATEAASNDVSYQLKVAKLDTKQQARMELALNGFAMLFGSQGAELFKSRELNVTSMNETALALSIALGPDFEKAIGRIQNIAKSSASDHEFETALNNILGDQLKNAKSAADRLKPILKGAVSGNEDSKRMVKALEPVIGYLLKQGELAGDVKENFLKQMKLIKEEQQRADAFTDVLRKFQRAVLKVYNSFMKTLLPVFKELADEFKISMLPAHITAWKDQLITLGHKALPYFKAFFENLTTPQGQELMMDLFKNMFHYLRLSVSAFIKAAIQSEMPNWFVSMMHWLDLMDDPAKIRAAAEAKRQLMENAANRLITPGMTGGVEPSELQDRIPIRVGDDIVFVSRGFQRNKEGKFQSFSGEYSADSAASRVTNKQLIDLILLAREHQAIEGIRGPDDREAFSGKSLLDREAMDQFLNSEKGKNRYGINFQPFIPSLYDSAQWQRQMGRVNDPRNNKFLDIFNDPDYLEMRKNLRVNYPATYQGMNTGTLGTLGSLFGNFGKGFPVELHGDEAVVTPAQLENVITANSQISVRDVVNRLNSNINRMIAIAKADVVLERSKLLAMN